MKTCSEYQEKLMMDVCHELSPDQKAGLTRHLAECEACRIERDRLETLFQSVRDEGDAPELTSEQVHGLSSHILRRLRIEKPEQRTFLRLVPAMTAAGLVMVVAVWLGLNDFKDFEKETVISGNVPEEQVLPEESELLENMEFLQEMDALEKLVKLLDDPENGGASDERESKVYHGSVRV